MRRVAQTLLLALLALPVGAATVLAQPAPPPPAGSPASPSAPGQPPLQTKFEHTDQTLEKLLNDGYEIRTSGGPFLFLGKSGALGSARWAACTVGLTNGMMADPAAVKTAPSTCFLMN